MSENNRLFPGKPELKPIHRAFDPTCGFYLARTKADKALHMIVAINYVTEEVMMCDPQTQEPPCYPARFEDIEIVARNDNPEQPKKLIVEG